jgi:hypothetical protein
MFGLKGDWSLEVKDRYFTLDDYCGAEPRWCTGCGDHGILAAVHRVCRDSQVKPEKTVFEPPPALHEYLWFPWPARACLTGCLRYQVASPRSGCLGRNR